MDPICHTLVGGALGETGLKRRSRLGLATLLLAANLPDIDVISLASGSVAPLGFRRGWTHGLPAIAALPLLLVILVVAWDHYARRRNPNLKPVRPRQLLLLAYLGTVTHPVLDYMNVYGMRWLMPFADRWVYGDVLFIVDPWIWALLGAGIFLSRRRAGSDRRNAGGPSRTALAAVALYIGIMAASGMAARRIVAADLPRHGLDPNARIMVAPLPVNPFRRLVVAEDPSGYRIGTFGWFRSPRVDLGDVSIARHDDHPRAVEAAASGAGRTFLHWARFPFFVIPPGDSLIHIVDARYTLDERAAFGALTIRP